MCTFNAESFLREALDSILAQTFHDFELIVVDDASTDRTPEVLAEYSDPRIRVTRNSSNLGVGGARNRGLSLACGKYIAIHDADDTSVPDRLAQQVAYLDANPGVGLIGSAQLHVITSKTLAETFPNIRDFKYPEAAVNPDKSGRVEFDTNWFTVPSSEPPMALVVSPLSDLAINWTLISHNAFANPTVMFRRSVYEKLGGFSEKPERRYVEDYPTYSLFARHSRVANLEAPLVTHRGHDASVSTQNEAEQIRQMETAAKDNICWIMGWDSVPPVTWSAWRKFAFPSSAASPITRGEVVELCTLLPVITSNFYAVYGFEGGAEVARHRQRTLYAWGRHAIGLSYKPGKTAGLVSRLLLASLGVRLLGNVVFPAKTTRSCERPSVASCLQSDTNSLGVIETVSSTVTDSASAHYND
jgi:glycosyltransferase involved in cell wall biosynthesis